ncbi:MAG: ABC transporter permease, partial [Gammaproteobacteria bacterium]|nr:ABC transporter permease [Gammaproteobacteria bacterium]
MPVRRRGFGKLLLALFFAVFVIFLYGPIIAVVVLSFQGPDGGLTFPMRGFSLHWFFDLFREQMVGDFKASFTRSLTLALLVTVLTVCISLAAGLAFRRPFRGATLLFYLTVTSLIVPSILITLGIGLMFDQAGFEPRWYTSGLGAHLTWTLPFGLLIMFAVF